MFLLKNHMAEFGLPREKNIFEEYLGKYVIIYPGMQSKNIAGKLVSVEDGIAIVNPFQGGNVDVEKGLIRKMIYKNSKLVISPGTIIEPTTKESLEAFCKYANKQEQSFKSKQNSQSNKDS